MYDFKYFVRPHFTMTDSNWGCDFDELTIDGKISEGGIAYFTKKGWRILSDQQLKDYYYNK